MSLDIKINHSVINFSRRKMPIAEVVFNDIHLFSWFMTEESKGSANPEFTAIGEFGYEQWYVWSPAGHWVPQYVNGTKSQEMVIPLENIPSETENAVRDTMGDALNLTYHPNGNGGEFDIRLNGEIVLLWRADEFEDDKFIVFDAAMSNSFGIWSGSTHGFSAWNNGNCKLEPLAVDAQFMQKVCQLAYRALHNGWIA